MTPQPTPPPFEAPPVRKIAPSRRAEVTDPTDAFVRKLLDRRALLSRLVFGFVGALAALLVGLVMEAAYLAAKLPGPGAPPLQFQTSPSRRDGEAQSQDAEVRRRLQEAGAKGGDIQATLSWNDVNDIDVHVVDPDKFRISYMARRSPRGGILDVDMNVSPPLNTQAVENILFPLGVAPDGPYEVWVNYYRRQPGGPEITPYRVELRIKGITRVFTGEVRESDLIKVAEVELGPDSVKFADEDRARPLRESAIKWDPSIIRAYLAPLLYLGLLAVALPLAWGQTLRALARRNWRSDLPFFRFRPLIALPWALGGAALGETLYLWAVLNRVDGLGLFLGWIVAGAGLGYGLGRACGFLPTRAATVVGLIFAPWVWMGASEYGATSFDRILAGMILGFALGALITYVAPKIRNFQVKRGGRRYGLNRMGALRGGGHAGSIGRNVS